MSGIVLPIAADAGEVVSRRGVVVGYVPQDDAFPAGATAREVVVAALAGANLEDYERETRAAATLTQVGFADHDRPAGALSGGWRKRLALARELAREPDLANRMGRCGRRRVEQGFECTRSALVIGLRLGVAS